MSRLWRAKRHLRTAGALRPSLAAAHLALGRIYQRQGWLRQARECWQRTLDADPTQRAAFAAKVQQFEAWLRRPR